MGANPLGHFPAGKLTTPKPNMKSILTTLAVLGLSVSAFAGCGKTDHLQGQAQVRSTKTPSPSSSKPAAKKSRLTLTAKTVKC
jgi:hypothetical protein